MSFHQVQFQEMHQVSMLLINRLFRACAKVLVNTAFNNLHTSGHASQEEQKLMLLLTKPKYFLPRKCMENIDNELKIHAELSSRSRCPKENNHLF